MKDEQKIYQVISEALDNLFAAQFLSMHDYNKLVDAGQMVRKGKYLDDRAFYKEQPEHLLAHALFYCGADNSAHNLEKLLE